MACTLITDLRIALVIFSFLHSGAGKLEIRRTDSPIEARLGHDTTVPCHISGYKASDLNTSMVYVDWKKEDKLVYFFNAGSHTPSRPGSYISERRLVRGDASLHIPDIRFSDEGEYTCFVIVTPDEATSTVTVRLSAMPACTVSDSRLAMNPDTERSVTCYVHGFYPQSVKIQWLKSSKASSNQSELDSRTCTSIPVQNQYGTYNVTSVLSVRPMSPDEDGDVYSCVVIHRSLKDDLTCNVTLSVHPAAENKTSLILAVVFGILAALLLLLAVLAIIYVICFKKARPKVCDIIGLELIHMQKTTLKCPIKNFSPQQTDLSLYIIKDNEKTLVDSCNSRKTKSEQDLPLLNRSYLKLTSSTTPCGNGSFICVCSITITPQLYEHDGAKMILEVQYEALKDPVCKELMLWVKARPVLDPIKANQESYNVGDQLKLTCKIHSFHPQEINVIWYKEEETLPSKRNEAQKAIDGFFYVTSCVQDTIKNQDFGKVFSCKVEHQGMWDKDEGVKWTLQKQVIKERASEADDEIDSRQEDP